MIVKSTMAKEVLKKFVQPKNITMHSYTATVIIPAYNAEKTIERCLEALTHQTIDRALYEIIVVDDGSDDGTSDVCRTYADVKVIAQTNQGPAAARNAGAKEAKGGIILFTDSDCEPMANWLEEMLKPFADPGIGGAKGSYRTKQGELTAQFVQLEYESRYEITKRHKEIDYIDTYSAAFRRDLFLKHGGYNTDFPLACAEDAEFSFRLKEAGVRMVFNPSAVVYHLHPNKVGTYFNKKVKFAYWRFAAGMMHPRFAVKDTHTPQTMKLQIVALYLAVLMAVVGGISHKSILMLCGVLFFAVFLVLSIPFYSFLVSRNKRMLLAGPVFIIIRSIGQGWGIILRLVDILLSRNTIKTDK
jgi:cellulose synthase/poly-beta-1,6-N-acetylglucosamine synthase-like glycosyltransferase